MTSKVVSVCSCVGLSHCLSSSPHFCFSVFIYPSVCPPFYLSIHTFLVLLHVVLYVFSRQRHPTSVSNTFCFSHQAHCLVYTQYIPLVTPRKLYCSHKTHCTVHSKHTALFIPRTLYWSHHAICIVHIKHTALFTPNTLSCLHHLHSTGHTTQSVLFPSSTLRCLHQAHCFVLTNKSPERN